MPIRFQVDADFYDHPKTFDLSDAAVALWTRAGSYSAAKLLDGFVPEAMIAPWSTEPSNAAAELVRHRLWRRVKGGYRFHQWDHRNLTKERVEADRKADRERKRTGRGNGGGKSRPRRSEPKLSDRNPTGIRPESGRIPEDSVSVSVSVSPEVSKQVGSSRKPTREPEHRAEDEPRSKPVGVKAAILSREYCDRVKLSDRAKVAGVVMAAIEGGYDDAQIKRGLRLLAKESRPVTPDTLRIAIDGKPPSGTATARRGKGREGW